ncbi:MAG: hypothetical protein U5J82_00450 [Desulfobacterales bacterium]|nr:hypothetical protein [Desulfobacterales bacterium]
MKVILLMAQTLDGKIGRNSGHFPDWTGKQDKRLFVRITKAADAADQWVQTYRYHRQSPAEDAGRGASARDKSRQVDFSQPGLPPPGLPQEVLAADLQAGRVHHGRPHRRQR